MIFDEGLTGSVLSGFFFAPATGCRTGGIVNSALLLHVQNTVKFISNCQIRHHFQNIRFYEAVSDPVEPLDHSAS